MCTLYVYVYGRYNVYSYCILSVHFSFHVLHKKALNVRCYIYIFIRLGWHYNSTIYDMVDIIFNNIRVLSESIFNFFFFSSTLKKSSNFHFVWQKLWKFSSNKIEVKKRNVSIGKHQFLSHKRSLNPKIILFDFKFNINNTIFYYKLSNLQAL